MGRVSEARPVLLQRQPVKTSENQPTQMDADDYGYVLAWRLGRWMRITWHDCTPYNAMYWITLPVKPVFTTIHEIDS